MAKKPATNKLWEPFSYASPGTCPICGKPTMAMAETDTIFMALDEDGVPTDPICHTERLFACMECGFKTDKYVCTDKGYRYSPFGYDEFVKEINREERSESGFTGNPFIKEF